MKKIILTAIGVLLFLAIVFSIGVEAILESILSIDPLVFAIAVALLVPSILLKGFKQKLLVSIFKPGTSLIENTKIWLISYFFGAASPAKSGEAARSLYLRKSFNLSLGEGLSIVFMERFLDTVFLFAFAFAGLLFMNSLISLSPNLIVSLLVFCVVFFFVISLMLKKEWVRFLLRPFFRAFAPEKFRPGLRKGFNDFYKAIQLYLKQPRKVLIISAITFASWLLIFVQFFIVAKALSINLTFLSFAFVFPVLLLVEALPVSLSGLGTRDAASVLMFGLFSISASAAVSFSLTAFVLNILLAAIGFLLFNSEKKPV
jgi:uncharacterized protein (TIRG00374 family)